MPKILVVDNEVSILSVLTTILRAEEFEVTTTKDGQKACEMISSEPFDLLISDIRMKPIGGMELLKHVRSERPEVAVIMLTAYGTIETAIEAMKLGAFDYVTKPFKVDELLITVQRALDFNQAIAENLNLKSQLKTRYRLENIIAESRSMKEICEMVERVAPTDATVLLYGESGTGKEVVAKAIHAYSHRKNNRFLAINCAALPEALLESEMFGHMKGSFTGASSNKIGLFEAAQEGTLLLDEIGSMPLSIQGKLLRVLQEKEIRRVGGNKNISVNPRVIAATNIPLEDMISEGAFREDLYYRLNVISLSIDPLRERKEDIMPLVEHILHQEIDDGSAMPEITIPARAILESYAWPGNVRELENAIKHALTFSQQNKITHDVLPAKIINAVGLPDAAEVSTDGNSPGEFETLKTFLQRKENEYLDQVMAIVDGDKEKAATALKISLATLYRKIAKEEESEGPVT